MENSQTLVNGLKQNIIRKGVGEGVIIGNVNVDIENLIWMAPYSPSKLKDLNISKISCYCLIY